MATPADTLYSLIKSYEDQFPLPAPYVTVNVGNFDAASGKFTGLATHVVTDPEPIEHTANQHPVNPAPRFMGASYIVTTIDSHWRRTTTTIPAPKVALAPVKLQFSVTNITSSWSVMVNGVTATAPPSQTTLAVSIWDSQHVSWTIQAGGKSHQDRLEIQRRAGAIGAGAGAFTVPALPMAIVYAPPKDSLGRSAATYAKGQTVGTTITTSFGTDNASTNPNMQTSYAAGAQFTNMLNVAGQELALAGPDGAAASKAMGIITSAIGKFSSTTTIDNATTNDDKITFTQNTTESFGTTAAAGGPGVGDVLVFARDIKMAWVSNGKQLLLMPLGFVTVEVPVGGLKNNPAQSQLTPADVQLLLSFDPFAAGGPSSDLPADRFQYVESLEYGEGTNFTHSETITRGSSTVTTTKNVTTQTDQWDAGPLFQLLGFGGKNTTTLSASNAVGADVSNSVSASLTLVSGPQDYFAVSIYYDTVFGTFAIQQNAAAPADRFAGVGTAPSQVVTLTSGKHVFRTLTDKDKHFRFRSRAIPAGTATLSVGNGPAKPVHVPPMMATATE